MPLGSREVRGEQKLTVEAYEKRERALKFAITYLRKATMMLHPRDYWQRVSSAYWTLLDEALDTACEIVKELPDEFFVTEEVESVFGLPGGKLNLSDGPLEKVEKLVALLERRRSEGKKQRRIALLSNVEGRTPEEAEAFRAKAAELAGRS